ncbi:MAG: hypothetical protein ABSB19_12820 [Methylomonas sp.]|jgi:hypothetical protein
MTRHLLAREHRLLLKACALSTLLLSDTSLAADKALLDTLLQNGLINQKQYDALIKSETTQSSGSLLDILKQNGAITQDQYNGLSKQPAAQAPAAVPAPAPAQANVSPPVAVAGNDGIIRGKGGVTEGGAPEPPRIGKEIVPGVTATFGGFIEDATMYRSKNESADVNSNFNTAIPFDNSANAHQTEFHESIRNSRISLLLGGDYDKNTKLGSYLEMDFLAAGANANSSQASGYSPRLRLGYALIDKSDWGFHFLAGQAWSMLTTNKVGINARTESIPLTVDAGYVPGFSWTRSAQLRFIQEFADHKVWAGLSLENPQWNTGGIVLPAAGGAIATTNGGVNITQPGVTGLGGVNVSTDVAPDIIAKMAFDPGWGHYEMFGVSRFFHTGVTTLNGNFSNHTVESLGGGLAAILPVVPKLLDIQMNFMGGSGIGRYNNAQLPDAAISASGNTVPLTEFTGLLGIIGHPDPNWDVFTYLGGEMISRYDQSTALNNNIGYGNLNANNSGCTTIGGVCNAQTHSVWQVSPGFWARLYDGDAGTVKTGLQYSYTQRAAFSGLNGITPHADENIMMLSFRYYPLQK